MNEKKCLGCGIPLQDRNILLPGYTTDMANDYCQRCFRIKNYGDYQLVTNNNVEYIELLKAVGMTNDLVVYVTDLLNLKKDFNMIRDIIPNKMILVLNKKDVLPKSVKEEKLIEYFKNYNIYFDEIITVSTVNNYNMDYLLKRIKFYQTTKNVYVVGRTNAGKSSLINNIIKNYSESNDSLTQSPLPSTTLNTVSIKLNDYLTLIDTPGLIDTGSIINNLDVNLVKKISPKKEIKPRTYQLRAGQGILIEDLVRIDYIEGERNSFTVFVSNELKVTRVSSNNDKLKELSKSTYDIKYDNDIVINGLGFIKVVNKGRVDIYINKDTEVFFRRSLI
ncbi:MAG: 50S ribosome-binding GTPase [Bacilli bacterium]|nr:50S ribosome-binding GTPase [Bacilli bacterium]